MNNAVDLARESCVTPETYDQDLKQMLKELIHLGISVEVCGSCMARCGIYKNEAYYKGAHASTMKKLAEWINTSNKVLTF